MKLVRHVDVKMKIKSNILLVILIFFLFRRVSGNLSRIVGGNAAPYHYGMFHASIQNLTGYHVCGGAVVSKLYVVTAAHCVYGTPGRTLIARTIFYKVYYSTTNINTTRTNTLMLKGKPVPTCGFVDIKKILNFETLKPKQSVKYLFMSTALNNLTVWKIIKGAHPEYMKIVAGTSNLVTGGKQYDVTKIIIYDHYIVETRENDIALLRVKRLFDARYIRPLKLREQDLIEGEEVLLSGFGAQEPNGISSNKMYSLNLTVFNQETCEYAMRYATRPVTKNMFCTFSQIGEGTCHGDSGSPLVKGIQLVGLVSWGIPCAVGFPDVHTRITPYIGWIQKHIKKGYCVPRKNTQRTNYEERRTMK